MTIVIKDKGRRKLDFDVNRLRNFIDAVTSGIAVPKKSVKVLKDKTINYLSRLDSIDAKDITKALINNALEFVPQIKDEEAGQITPDSLTNTKFVFVAKEILLRSLYKRASKNRAYSAEQKYGDYLGLVYMMLDKQLYDPQLVVKYTPAELQEAGKWIRPEQDKVFDYAGLLSLHERYLVKDYDGSVLELPQERWLTIALTLMQNETVDRLAKVKELYWALSNMLLTMATPITMNAGRPAGGLISCHIVTTEDSLDGIYSDLRDIATFSKNSAGIGTYLGKIRAAGGAIRGVPGVARGIIGWIKGLDNTAVYVDQLGVRAGAIAVYLDVWHMDIHTFLDMRMNTGDKSIRAQHVFTGVCMPDHFWRQVEARGDWYLFDPHNVKEVMGFSLEDCYDAKPLGYKEVPNPEDHEWTYKYNLCINHPDLRKVRTTALEIYRRILQSRLETGIPYIFNRDTANRLNPNKHAGMIYASNLCTEIMNNTSATVTIVEEADDTGIVTHKRQAGDLVICDLASLVLNNIHKYTESTGDRSTLRRTIEIAVRALDNVIDLSRIAVPAADITAKKYRSIGLGEQGVAALLAYNQIMWDSDEAIHFIDSLEEDINYYTVQASWKLAVEKGAYPTYQGSDWNTGSYFTDRGYISERWSDLAAKVQRDGIRNGYLRAIAPTGGTSVIAGSTAGVDPITDVVHYEKKGDFIPPVVVPDLSFKTWYFYKPTLAMEYEGNPNLAHLWSIKHNIVRQRHVDQAISANIYVPSDVKASELRDIDLYNWRGNVKTTYYTRSWDHRAEESCLACSS